MVLIDEFIVNGARNFLGRDRKPVTAVKMRRRFLYRTDLDDVIGIGVRLNAKRAQVCRADGVPHVHRKQKRAVKIKNNAFDCFLHIQTSLSFQQTLMRKGILQVIPQKEQISLFCRNRSFLTHKMIAHAKCLVLK